MISHFRGTFFSFIKTGRNCVHYCLKMTMALALTACIFSYSQCPPLSYFRLSYFFFNFGGDKCFSWHHWYLCFGLLVTSALRFKARVDPFLHIFSLVRSSDSPLVWHLLTIQRSAWQPRLFDPHTCKCVQSIGGGSGLEPTTICVASTALKSTRPLLLHKYIQLSTSAGPTEGSHRH